MATKTLKKTTARKPAAKKTVKPVAKTALKTAPKVVISDAAATMHLTDLQPATKTAPKAVAKKAIKEGKSKMELATELFVKMKGEPRKTVIAAFIDRAGLTKAGSNTYYAIIKAKNT